MFMQFGGDEVSPCSFNEAEIVVLPICYERSPSYGKGAAEAPRHILEASAQLEALDAETLINWTQFNIHTLPPLIPKGSAHQAVREIQDSAQRVLEKGKFLFCIGGDHAVTIGSFWAAIQCQPHLGVLQIDAHLDLRDSWNGSHYNHACVMRRIFEKTTHPIIQVGIRSICQEELDFINTHNLRPYYAHQISPESDAWIDEVVGQLPASVYLTIDVDGLDPSVLPGTGTPEPGGLTYRQLMKLIQSVGRHKHLVAADITEVMKIPGSLVSEYTAAKIASQIFIYAKANL
jgi:agmatinase